MVVIRVKIIAHFQSISVYGISKARRCRSHAVIGRVCPKYPNAAGVARATGLAFKDTEMADKFSNFSRQITWVPGLVASPLRNSFVERAGDGESLSRLMIGRTHRCSLRFLPTMVRDEDATKYASRVPRAPWQGLPTSTTTATMFGSWFARLKREILCLLLYSWLSI